MASASLPYSVKMKQTANTLWPILKETASDWMEDNAMRLSAALALYTILSMAPLLVISAKVVGMVMGNNAKAQQNLQDQLTSLMGGAGQDASKLIQAMIAKGNQPGQGVLAAVIGFAVLAFSATGVFVELQDSMNTIWGVKPKPNQGIWGFIRNRLLSLGMVFGIGFLLLVSMFISTVLSTMAKGIAGDASWVALPVGPRRLVRRHHAALRRHLQVPPRREAHLAARVARRGTHRRPVHRRQIRPWPSTSRRPPPPRRSAPWGRRWRSCFGSTTRPSSSSSGRSSPRSGRSTTTSGSSPTTTPSR